MKILFYSTKPFEIDYINNANTNRLKIVFTENALALNTVKKAEGFDTVCIFTNDDASKSVIKSLYSIGVKYIAIRATGYDNVDIETALKLKIKIANVPEYSPHAIAEHTIMMMLSLIRKSKITDRQIQIHNFTIDNLIGFNINNKTVGIIGTGKIGSVVAKILYGFGARIIAYDIKPNAEITKDYNVKYVDIETLCITADIITIHTPLNHETRYMINDKLLSKMKDKVIIINTARGAIVNTNDLLKHLRSKHVRGYGMDVYEHEKGVFYYNLSNKIIEDKQLLELIENENVLVTPHQAFATIEALQNIVDTTIYNFNRWNSNESSINEIFLHPKMTNTEKILDLTIN